MNNRHLAIVWKHMPCLFTREISNDSQCSRSYGLRLRLRLRRKIMSTPISHNFDIPSFAFHPSRFTLLSHVANLFLLKGNPYNLNLLLILEHPQAELLYCLKTRQMRPIMASTHPSTNRKLVRHWPNSMYPRLWPDTDSIHIK